VRRSTRLQAVLAIVLGGAVAIVSSTQPWLEITLRTDDAVLTAPGADALTLLAPLSLAALALGLALTVVGRVLRVVFGVLAVAIGGSLLVGALRVGVGHPVEAISATVTDATRLSGSETVMSLVAAITATAWPFLTAAAAVLIAAGGLLTLLTGHRWQSAGRRYRTDGAVVADRSRPPDAIDSWDDLSRGDDPTR